jgi:L-glyceraldehyde 3-phosphate reductase
MYTAAADRYDRIPYARCGRSGLQLPRISLGLWQNFGGADSFDNARDMILKSFDHGITHFDLANNYGPPPGSAEENFGRIVATDLAAYRDVADHQHQSGLLDVARPVR